MASMAFLTCVSHFLPHPPSPLHPRHEGDLEIEGRLGFLEGDREIDMDMI